MTTVNHQPPFSVPAQAGAWLRRNLGVSAQLTLDSRQVAAGDGFLATPGLTVDGRDFVSAAIELGATAVLTHCDDHDDGYRDEHDLPMGSEAGIVARRAMIDLAGRSGEVAAAFYGDPSAAMQIIAVTGTNGKTSCAHWLADGAARDGDLTAAIGTLGVSRYGSHKGQRNVSIKPASLNDATLTTPDAVSMQRVLAQLARSGTSTVALEASSIGLDQNRLGGVQVDIAIFTNLTRDHLDYHGCFEDYRQAKARLFAWPGLKVAIVNGDDPGTTEMLQSVPAGVRTIAYGFEPHRFGRFADQSVTINSLNLTGERISMRLTGDLGDEQVSMALAGRFNALNAAAVWAAWCALGVPSSDAAQRLANLVAVPGRMQSVHVPGAPLVIVDFAHTPDALRSVLEALSDQRAARGGQLWCVFGCGGDRDAGKRPEMAAIAQAGADQLVLTSDNPRSESMHAILEDMLAGLTTAPWAVEPDRAVAIDAAVAAAAPADIILVAGKGHESWQEIAGVKTPFLDEAVARAALTRRAESIAQGGARV